MKTTLITLLSFLMLSCGSIKKNKFSSTSEVKENLDIKASAGSSTKNQTFENASIRIENNGFNISVKPFNGQDSFFNFTSPDGQLFQGTTNAEINFEKKAEKKEEQFTKKTITETTYWSHVTYKSHITNKTVTRYLDKYKEAYPWYYILFAGFMLRELLRLLWNWLKKSNWYLNLIQKISKKK
ncbi:hypothetical protein [Chryseobacterium sp. NFX27]|uniref:hypothetical protein n=1 Tax=Chryseobacterium sp. NFX27 TaxID=2819618 RepID=UPI003CE97987